MSPKGICSTLRTQVAPTCSSWASMARQSSTFKLMMTRAGSLVGPLTSLCSSMKNWTGPNSNAPMSFSLTSKAWRYHAFMASTLDEPTSKLPTGGVVMLPSSRRGPVAAVALHQPAVELRQRPFLPRVATPRAEAGPQPPLHHRVGPHVLDIEVVDAGLRRREQLLEQRHLERLRIEAVADVDRDGSRVLRPDDEVRHLVGHDGERQRGRDEAEHAAPPLLLGEGGEDRHEALHRRVERAVDLREVLDTRDVAHAVTPVEEIAHARGGERLERLVQAAGVVRVVEVLHHDLPVPREV